MIRGQIAADYVTGSDPEKINTMQGIRKNLCSLAYPAVGQRSRRCAANASPNADTENGCSRC